MLLLLGVFATKRGTHCGMPTTDDDDGGIMCVGQRDNDGLLQPMITCGELMMTTSGWVDSGERRSWNVSR